MGLEEGIIPSRQNYTQKSIEEERRLFYVAITRAEERLYLSYADSRMTYGQPNFSGASRFLSDIVINQIRKGNTIPKYTKTKETTTHYEPKPKAKKGEYNVGDRVEHVVFGKGTINGEFDGFYIIKFDDVASPKKVIVDHPLLKRIKEWK